VKSGDLSRETVVDAVRGDSPSFKCRDGRSWTRGGGLLLVNLGGLDWLCDMAVRFLEAREASLPSCCLLLPAVCWRRLTAKQRCCSAPFTSVHSLLVWAYGDTLNTDKGERSRAGGVRLLCGVHQSCLLSFHCCISHGCRAVDVDEPSQAASRSGWSMFIISVR